MASGFTSFPTLKTNRKFKAPLSVEVVCYCGMPLHFDSENIVRAEGDDDVILCDECNKKFHPKCVSYSQDYSVVQRWVKFYIGGVGYINLDP